MDIALVSVLSSAALGLAAVVMSAHGIQVGRLQAREERVEGRRADAYLELLTLVEAEGQWVETWMDRTAVESTYSKGDIRPEIAPRLTAPETARARAIVMAYGSTDIQKLWGAWNAAIHDIESEIQNLNYLWAGRSNHIDQDDLKKLDNGLVPAERGLRVSLAATASAELNDGAQKLYWRRVPARGLGRLAFWR